MPTTSASQCLDEGSLTPNLAAVVAWASELPRMPKPKKPKQSAAQSMTLSKSCGTQDHRISLFSLVGVIGRRVSGYIPQTPRRSPEEHNSARGKMPRRGLVSY